MRARGSIWEAMGSGIRRIAVLVTTGAGILALSLVAAPPAAAGTDDFSYDSWDVAYEITADRDGRAVARVTETLTARFPDYDQNRGLVRGIPIDYEGASTDPRDVSVTDGAGNPVPFEVQRENGFVVVLTGDDDYVHGVQRYAIEYTLSDVILARDDGAADEFYWDVVDHEHRQRIDSFSGRITVSPELAGHLDGNARCYSGTSYSTGECTITPGEDGFDASTGELSALEGVTVAIGFEPGTFTQPPQRRPNFALDGLPLVLGGAGAAAGIGGSISIARMKRRRRTARGVVVAQYEVPPQLPPLLAGPVAGASGPAVPAQILHLAVSGAIRIEDGETEHGLFGDKPGRPVLRVMDPQRVGDPLDRKTLGKIFSPLEPGEAFTVPKSSDSFAQSMQRLTSAGRAEATARGYFTRERDRAARTIGFVLLGIAPIVLGLSLVAWFTRVSPTPVIGLVLTVVLVVFAIVCLKKHRVSTPLGAEWREFLEGVRLFITVAEAERLQMLQSYSGAERRADGSVDVVHLYEKLLPYAVLFGVEREWGRVLQVRYEESAPGYAPGWYPAFGYGTGDLSGSIASFTGSMQASATYSSSSSSSSSGGSSGGGFSGGGGGGGFSGGR